MPPIEEQRRIAAILDQAEALRAKRRQALAKLDTLTQSLFLEMFGDPVMNGRHWNSSRLVNATVQPNGVKAGPFGSALKKEEYKLNGYRVYGQEQVIAGRFDIGNYYIDRYKFERLSSCAVQAGDVLISLVGSFGSVLVVPDGIEPGIINPRLLRIRPDLSKVNSFFLAELIKLPSIQNELLRHSHGGTMGILNAGLIKELTVVLPPLQLQDKFVATRGTIRKHLNEYKISSEKLDSLVHSLQHRAFRGEL